MARNDRRMTRFSYPRIIVPISILPDCLFLCAMPGRPTRSAGDPCRYCKAEMVTLPDRGNRCGGGLRTGGRPGRATRRRGPGLAGCRPCPMSAPTRWTPGKSGVSPAIPGTACHRRISATAAPIPGVTRNTEGFDHGATPAACRRLTRAAMPGTLTVLPAQAQQPGGDQCADRQRPDARRYHHAQCRPRAKRAGGRGQSRVRLG
jgi:hypothetical protein